MYPREWYRCCDGVAQWIGTAGASVRGCGGGSDGSGDGGDAHSTNDATIETSAPSTSESIPLETSGILKTTNEILEFEMSTIKTRTASESSSEST